jgi:DNA-binding MarR family transcriptional regulator
LRAATIAEFNSRATLVNEMSIVVRNETAIARELAESTAYLLVSLGVSCKARVQARVDDAGFEIYDYSVLALLGEGARTTQAAIADILLLDPSRLVALLDSLEERGMIARQRDPQDRRRHVVSITPEGAEQLVRMRRVVAAIEDEFFSPLSDVERATLHELLVKLAVQNDPRCCPMDEEAVALFEAEVRSAGTS